MSTTGKVEMSAFPRYAFIAAVTGDSFWRQFEHESARELTREERLAASEMAALAAGTDRLYAAGAVAMALEAARYEAWGLALDARDAEDGEGQA